MYIPTYIMPRIREGGVAEIIDFQMRSFARVDPEFSRIKNRGR